jgi:redox-sensitive bicupin YhaK (pirin superfamily)
MGENSGRYLAEVVAGVPATDGAGVSLTRMIGTPECDMIDPFLMLDRIDSDDPDAYVAGFPDHPHRGFETVTFMLDGRMRHRDSVGNDGVLEPGDVQWMTAGRGIIHSEMPEMVDGRLRGFQLWVNLPARDKMTAPAYQDIQAAQIPTVEHDGASVRVIAGSYGGATGPARSFTPVRILDATLPAGARFAVESADGASVFAVVYEGAAVTGDGAGAERRVTATSLARFAGAGTAALTAGDKGASVLYCEGRPIGEPVARYGPFVMTSRSELLQAVQDFEAGTFAAR